MSAESVCVFVCTYVEYKRTNTLAGRTGEGMIEKEKGAGKTRVECISSGCDALHSQYAAIRLRCQG